MLLILNCYSFLSWENRPKNL